MDLKTLRTTTIEHLKENQHKIADTHSLIGLDGFVDHIIQIIDKRESLEKFTTIATIEIFAERIKNAAGKSTNLETYIKKVKPGGNGLLMAIALQHFKHSITYIGTLGKAEIHPVFDDFASKAQIFSLAEPGLTDALEFDDGKIMLTRNDSLNRISYQQIIELIGTENFTSLLQNTHLIGLTNWTMIPQMTDIWHQIIEKHCPLLTDSKDKTIFFDLADPEKRIDVDIVEALQTMTEFSHYFKVVLGLNDKESLNIARLLNLPIEKSTDESMAQRAQNICTAIDAEVVVIHRTKSAAAANNTESVFLASAYIDRPQISTGAGDYFNAGFCMGLMAGLNLQQSLLTANATSGFYVRSTNSPNLNELMSFIENWSD